MTGKTPVAPPPAPDGEAAATRCGYVGVLGRANAGKTTLVNALVGEKVAIVGPRPQTTRRRIMGVRTRGRDQFVFCDTPGLHAVRHALDGFMREEVHETLPGLALALYLVDASAPAWDEDAAHLADLLAAGLACPVALVVAKCDRVRERARLDEIVARARALHPFVAVCEVAATKDRGLEPLLDVAAAHLPPGPHPYDADTYTLEPERDIAAEVIREQILARYRHEVPHALAVVVEEFKERDGGKTYIRAVLHPERESHKKILVGRGGSAIKALGTAARLELNRMLGRDIFLELWVKVVPGWRKKAAWLRRLGYRHT